ncbi:hypothetical protein VYU27_007836 [Nannochloropsis oceanica]
MKRDRVIISSSSFHSTSSSRPSPTSSSPLRLLRSTRKKWGLMLSTVAILGLLTVGDLMALPSLTKEAVEITEASLNVLHSIPDSQRDFSYANYDDNPLLKGVEMRPVAKASSASLANSSVLLALSPSSPLIAIYDNTTCMYGGVLTTHGCVCGRRTAGYRCEELLVSEAEIKKQQMCGKTCWAGYVWYNTLGFKYTNIPPEEEEIWQKVKNFLAWSHGGVLRQVPQQLEAVARLDPVVEEWLEALGPFTLADRKMIDTWRSYRHKELDKVEARHLARIARPEELAKKDRARLCFGLIIHKDAAQFEALWRVIYRPHHHYVIHIDRGADPSLREQILQTIEATPFSTLLADAETQAHIPPSSSPSFFLPKNVWENVDVVPEEESVNALWGDITLVYLEAIIWLHAFRHEHWEWDYFVNLSGSDIPIVSIPDIEQYLGLRAPGSFLHFHANAQEFRQTHIFPERSREGEVIVLSPFQAEMPSGRWRARHGQSRIYGCTQWHMLHYTLAYEMAMHPDVQGLLLSLKDTGIPDESFFATAALWLQSTAAKQNRPQLPIVGGDMKYRNEGFRRDLRYEGEKDKIKRLGTQKSHLWARKAYTAHVTCDYTNYILGLSQDCSPYEGLEEISEIQ